MATNWVSHNGKQILLADYSGVQQENDMMSILFSTPQQLNSAPNNARILYLIDLSNSAITRRFTQISQKIEQEVFFYFQIKQAVVGLSPLSKLWFLIQNPSKSKRVAFFKTRQEAIEYLTNKSLRTA